MVSLIVNILSFMTITRYLHRHGYLTEEELKYEIYYNIKKVPRIVCFFYMLFVAIPVTTLLYLLPFLAPTVNKIARFIWIDRAIKGGKALKPSL